MRQGVVQSLEEILSGPVWEPFLAGAHIYPSGVARLANQLPPYKNISALRATARKRDQLRVLIIYQYNMGSA